MKKKAKMNIIEFIGEQYQKTVRYPRQSRGLSIYQ